MLKLFIGFLFGSLFSWIVYRYFKKQCDALDNERIKLVQEKEIVLEFMHNLVEDIGEGLNRKELFQRVVHTAIISARATSACVYELTKNKRLQNVATEGLYPPQSEVLSNNENSKSTRTQYIDKILSSEVIKLGDGLIGSVAKNSKSVLITDAINDPRVIKHTDPSLQIKSIIVIPILFRKRLLGILSVVNPVDGNAFNETDFSITTSLAEQAGLAIHNLDLMNFRIEKNKLDVDLSLASNIQGMLLPQTFPEKTVLDINAYYKPAQKVGGDLYDVFSLSNHRVGITIADVSGKGIPASILMAQCQSNMRHLSQQYDSPAQVLQEVNHVLTSNVKNNMFITLIYAIIDTDKNKITLARAGHELPLLFHGDQNSGIYKTAKIDSEGMALGMVPAEIFNSVFYEVEIDFVKNDILLLYTDGITEGTNQDGVEFTDGRLADTVISHRNKSAEEINQGILISFNSFCDGNGQTDDITLVTVRHK